MIGRPKILRVEYGKLTLHDSESGTQIQLVNVIEHTPKWWRKIEELIRLDVSLAFHVKLYEQCGDVIWAGSEKVGIPLSFMGLRKPLIVIAHHMSSPGKAKFARLTGVVKKWDGIGFISDESKQFLMEYFGVKPDQLFQYESSKYIDMVSESDIAYDGPIMSAGVAKRDYNTLIAALSQLPEYHTELFISSKFGDQLQRKVKIHVPKWVKVVDWVSEEELIKRYHRMRFMIVPLEATTHSGAGINAAIEASAIGKAVIATRTGGMETFVQDGETGILVPPHDVQAMKDAIQTLWTQPALAARMGIAGRRYVKKRFDPQKVNANISLFIERLGKQQFALSD